MNWNIIGHEWAVDLLKSHLRSGNLRHAYLITGPDGTGRRTLALKFAQAINCLNPEAIDVPCNECKSCLQFTKMAHPDLSVVEAEAPSGFIKVNQIRELQRNLHLSPYEAKYRIALLLDFENSNPSAANALLKTLEEPPPQVILVLTAESRERLLPTIVSRCEEVRLRPLNPDIVSKALQERWNVPEQEANKLGHLSNGRPGFAIQLLENQEMTEMHDNWIRDLFQLMHQNKFERMVFAKQISSDRKTTHQVLHSWLTLFRDLMIQSAGSHGSLTNTAFQDQIEELTTKISLKETKDIVKHLEKSQEQLEKYINPRLIAEITLLSLPNI